jgi:peptide deformylase
MEIEENIEETSERKLVSIFDGDGPIILKKISKEVELPLSTDDLELIGDLLKYTIEQGGKGMAAIQFGEDKRIFVFENPAGSGRLQVVINPEIHRMSGKRTRLEGCFSVPFSNSVGVKVSRPSDIVVSYWTEENDQIQNEQLGGNTSQTFLHEYSHLEGLTMLDSSKYGKFIEVVRIA